ncbi:ribonuclease H-like domain-containing protein [Rhizophagus irregularis DAOM 181602=DAOM 197198]|uniref:Ribonuclease H-like domain-containing protein n=1 Tax=Rhizophagus irregularis (strain DAOM 181602 / DAOM 197198 / MUCL 43194) TaxID=747089 RepID=A0A2P4PBY7_RHIID|nr:ribonuclease H-like domain-containing protein [Rhizophagus irregularis DAOM 181602=DAOM 197198]POG62909.1 ribonuclease H-like domain-containing protein [Rhizophagus irregularis DAOM 181602=DAOM 197198]|eukprot:XP_025169775.1 ribonuclease H-like domain-containing protein [Rhizophagus irregularis DAOM 181602=DAOM 197198]
MAPRPPTPPIDGNTLHHPKRSQQWVTSWIPHLSDIVYGKLLSTNNFPNCCPVSYMEHWIHKDISASSLHTSPRSTPNILIRCQGCAQHFSYYVGDMRPKCIIQVKHKDLILLEALPKKKKEDLFPRPNVPIKDFQLLKYSHPNYRLMAFNDHLIQRGYNSTVNFRPINPPIQDNSNVPNTLRNMDLITKLFDDLKISEDLQDIATTLAPFIDLEFFTDGSYDSTNSQAGFPMGYGWTTSNLFNSNITYNGSLQFFPSSTKAETMAILTALVVCPEFGKIVIHTDSQAAIDSFHKSKNLHTISPRRFNKINNNILWSSIHFTIKSLSLKVKLLKVKAHSGNQFNDIADIQAKLGRTQPIPTTIIHDHLPNQTITLNWNNEVPWIRIILIKINIWKARNQKWKALRDAWGITKTSFTKYRDIFLRNQRTAAALNRPGRGSSWFVGFKEVRDRLRFVIESYRVAHILVSIRKKKEKKKRE